MSLRLSIRYREAVQLVYKRTGRSGTLWESRFRSTVVQGGAAVTEMAAYIDLNPVRAGLVDDPKDYRWSQYGAAIGGADAQAREGLETVVAKYSSLTEEEQLDWNRVQARYRILMYRRGLQVTLPNGQVEGVFEPEEVDKIWAEGGKISGISYAATRVRYFTDGLVIGSKEYVDKLFRENRSCFGKNRKSGARTMQGADWGDLRSMRDLQKTPVGEA